MIFYIINSSIQIAKRQHGTTLREFFLAIKRNILTLKKPFYNLRYKKEYFSKYKRKAAPNYKAKQTIKLAKTNRQNQQKKANYKVRLFLLASSSLVAR